MSKRTPKNWNSKKLHHINPIHASKNSSPFWNTRSELPIGKEAPVDERPPRRDSIRSWRDIRGDGQQENLQ